MSAVLDAAKNVYFDVKWRLHPQKTNGGHKGTVYAIAFFQDSQRVVTGSKDHTLRTWNVEKEAFVGEPFKGHKRSVYCVAVSPDDRRIVSGGRDKTVIIWDVETKRKIFKLEKHTDLVRSVCFSSDGNKVASGSYDGTVVVWDAHNGSVLVTLESHRHSLVSSVAFSPDGVNLASGSWNQTIQVWRTDNAEPLFEIALQGFLPSVVWSPDGQQLVSASDSTVKFWDASTGHQIGQSCIGHTSDITSLAISTDGSFIASASRDFTVRLWDTNTRQQIALVGKFTRCTTISPNGALLACSDLEGIRLWSVGEMLKGDAGEGKWKQEIGVEKNPHIASSTPLRLGDTVTSHETNFVPQAPSVQADSDSHSLIPAGAMLHDLTTSITKVGDHPVARGGFGEIWKCTYQTDRGQINVAVKALLMYASDEFGEGMEKKTKRIWRELKTCASLAHKNVLPVFGYTYGFGLLMALVCPWAENGNLTTYLNREDATLTIVRRFQILRDVSAGLQYLHASNVIHGDLTGPNVLIHGDGTACLADFGLSLMYSEVITKSAASWTSAFHGNFRWLAPELLGQSDDDLPVRPSQHSDIYSFGGIMLQVLTSKIPYHYLGETAVIVCIGTGVKPLRSHYPVFSDQYWHFIEECWSAEPLDRPSTGRLFEFIRDELDLLSSSSTDK